MNSNAPDSDRGKWACEFVGEVLREMREAQGKTQDDVASAAGLSRNGLHLIETGVSSPSVKNVEAIAEALNSSLNVVSAQAENKRKRH